MDMAEQRSILKIYPMNCGAFLYDNIVTHPEKSALWNLTILAENK